jgi:hypothetical protein
MTTLSPTSPPLTSSELSACELIQSSIADLRHRLLSHPIYSRIETLPQLRVFMQHHGFAVLDFMWLLKRLQRELCCVEVPWLPAANPELSRFINEIVLAEESDEDGDCSFASHFELYVRAMRDVGSDVKPLLSFVDRLRKRDTVADVLAEFAPSGTVRDFVEFTFNIASKGLTAEVASVFCFGREDIIPEMFERLLQGFQQSEISAPRFAYYVRRHIELDGDQHGPLALRLVNSLCDTDEKTTAAIAAARRAIELRIQLWDGVLQQLDSAC